MGPPAGGNPEARGFYPPLPLQGIQGRPGPEPHQDAGKNRARGNSRGHEAHPLQVSRSAAFRPGAGQGRGLAQGLRRQPGHRGPGPRNRARREDGIRRPERRRQIHPDAHHRGRRHPLRRHGEIRVRGRGGLVRAGHRRKDGRFAQRRTGGRVGLPRRPAAQAAQPAGRLPVPRRRHRKASLGAFRRRAFAPGAPQNADAPGQPPGAGRTDQPPGPDLQGRPAGSPEGVRRHRPVCIARPRLHRGAGRPRAGTRSRRGAPPVRGRLPLLSG